MRKLISLLSILTLSLSCNTDDDGTTSTGNTQEYFKYTVDGVERVFDYEVESHLETESTTSIDRFEINASGQYANGDLRRIAASFTFLNTTFLLSNTPYVWGLADGITNMQNFYFAESTVNHLFVLDSNQPITAEITTVTPDAISDYFEFTFTGTFTETNGIVRTISGECRVQRDTDQHY